MGLKRSNQLKEYRGSGNLFGLRSDNKILAVKQMVHGADDGNTGGLSVLGKFMDGCSTEEQTFKPGPVHKLRSTGSKIISLMRLSRSSGMIVSFSANIRSK